MSGSLEWKLLFNSIDDLEKTLIKNKAGKVQLEGEWYCLLYTGEELFAFETECPHQNFPLLGASCQEGKLICPLHKFQFNLASGQGHGLSLSTFPIKKEEGKYYIGLQNQHTW